MITEETPKEVLNRACELYCQWYGTGLPDVSARNHFRTRNTGSGQGIVSNRSSCSGLVVADGV